MHETSAESNRLIGFGVFELDLRSGELRKSGVRLTLQQQPLQLLSVLLEQPGEIVTRDTLRKRLWPEDTFVDFEHGLNAAVKRLRDTLGDAADLPRFIETIPRRGYRFIAPVTKPDPVAVVEEPVKRRVRVRWLWVAAAITAAGALALVVSLTWRPPARVAASDDPASALPIAGPLIQLTTGSHLTTEPAVSADGEWVAYASDRSGEGHLDIWIQRLSGGEPVRLTDDRADDREPTFSADGGRIAFRSERDGGGIYVIPAHSGGEARLLVRGSAHGPRFSPDGRWLAYSTGAGRFSTDKIATTRGETYMVSSTGGEPRRLLPEFVSATWPVWSPDGRHVLLTATRGFTDMPEWWVVSTDGASPTTKVSFDTGTGTSRFPVRPWRWLDRDRIVYSTALGGDSWDLWEVEITRKTWAAATKSRRLTMGAGLQGHASIAPNNLLVFANLTQVVNVWSIPLDADRGRVTGPMQRVTSGTTLQWGPSASHDGRLLVFGSLQAKTRGVWLHDLETARETLLAPAHFSQPVITGDGSRVAYVARDSRALYAVASSGGPTEKLCVDCAQPWITLEHWSGDKTRLLYETGNPSAIFVLDLRSGAKRVVAQHASYGLWQARFSPDDRWISFLAADAKGGTRLWIVPFSEGSLPREQEWIAVTDGEQWDDKPRWSPDGNLIYFTSLRDGFHCLWSQRLRPESRQPIGPAFPVQHLHSARLSVNNAGLVMLGTAVTRDKLLINLGELSGNIWTASLR
jgi:Tol biopolymer transport system component/DNA-binding winged helix-turn-helix (wHTH) protein